MFDNIGNKIKLVAKVNCGIIAAAGVILGFTARSFFVGLLIVAIGAAAGWISSIVMYGFGELVESVSVLRQASENQQAQAAASARHAPAEGKGYSLSEMAAQRQNKTANGWVCKNCNKRNYPTTMYCSDCGTSR